MTEKQRRRHQSDENLSEGRDQQAESQTSSQPFLFVSIRFYSFLFVSTHPYISLKNVSHVFKASFCPLCSLCHHHLQFLLPTGQ